MYAGRKTSMSCRVVPSADIETAAGSAMTPEQRLWVAVTEAAIYDATRLSLDNKMCEQARAWLLGMRRDFKLVCEWAGLDPAYVHRLMKTLADQGWPPKYADVSAPRRYTMD
jgi:hypothetical protein